MVRREDDRPEAIGSRGGLGKAGFVRGALSAPLESHASGKADAWPMCATHRAALVPSTPPATRLVLGRVARDGLSMGSPDFGGGTLRRRALCRSLSGRGRGAAVWRLRPSHRPVLGAWCRGPGSAASKRSTWP